MPIKFLLLSLFILPPCYVSATSVEDAAKRERHCRNISEKLASVNYRECLAHKFDVAEVTSVKGAPLFVKRFNSRSGNPHQKKIMLIGGIHGDEYSSVSVIFKWIALLNQNDSDTYQWQVVPLLNPDGLLQYTPRRTNANGVDLNKNFPVSDSQESVNGETDGFAGNQALSEPETEWLAKEIASYRPDAIISVHAPHDRHVYQLPKSRAIQTRLGAQYQESTASIPGSLDQFVGSEMNIPVLTMELAYAEIMPSQSDISEMWQQIGKWLDDHLE